MSARGDTRVGDRVAEWNVAVEVLAVACRTPDYPAAAFVLLSIDGLVVFVGGHLLGLLSAEFFGETVEHVTEAKVSLPNSNSN